MDDQIPNAISDYKLIQFIAELRMDLRRTVLFTAPGYSSPEYYLIDIQNFLDRFPVNQWTSEYMLDILEIIKSGINNNSPEEFIKIPNPDLYSLYMENRKKLSKTLFRMKSINAYHKYFL